MVVVVKMMMIMLMVMMITIIILIITMIIMLMLTQGCHAIWRYMWRGGGGVCVSHWNRSLQNPKP